VFILWRYILKEHVTPFLFALFVIILLFLLNLVFRELGRILSRGLPFKLVLEFFFLNMAWIIALAVPMAILVATLMAFGRLSGDGEIVAMKAGGVSIPAIILPVFVASIFLTLFLVWFNNSVLPDFNHRARLLASDIARKRPTLSLEAGVIYRDLPDYNLLVQEIREVGDTSFVKKATIIDNSDPNKSKIIFAKSGKIFMNQQAGLLVLMLYDGEMHDLDLTKMEQYRKLTFPKERISIAVPDMMLTRSESDYRGDREKSAQMMLAEVRANDADIRDRYRRISELIDATFSKYLPNLKIDTASEKKSAESGLIKTAPRKEDNSALARYRLDFRRLKQQLSGETNVIESLERSSYVLMVEIHKKYSIPVACIVFVLVGAPLGIMSRKGSLTVATGISFGFFLLYWASLIGGEELADNEFITPFMAMWSANFIVGAGGIYLILHSIHEATFINWISFNKLLGAFFIKAKNIFNRRIHEDS
jgi:lipopolysaccharide export system permease protein